jgi:hypothetical protein
MSFVIARGGGKAINFDAFSLSPPKQSLFNRYLFWFRLSEKHILTSDISLGREDSSPPGFTTQTKPRDRLSPPSRILVPTFPTNRQ